MLALGQLLSKYNSYWYNCIDVQRRDLLCNKADSIGAALPQTQLESSAIQVAEAPSSHLLASKPPDSHLPICTLFPIPAAHGMGGLFLNISIAKRAMMACLAL